MKKKQEHCLVASAATLLPIGLFKLLIGDGAMSLPTTEFYKPTPDDWAPNFPNGTVRVRAYTYPDDMRRVCIWGGDDTGMELDTYDARRAEVALQTLAGASLITMQMLREMGFKRA